MASIPETRREIAAAEGRATAANARLRQERLALDAELREGKTDAGAARRLTIAALEQQQALAQAQAQAARQTLEGLRRAAVDALPSQNPLGALDSSVPIALFPVRLETRFRAAGAGKELLIRIYPDDIHIHTHEAELTAEETNHGRIFWRETWRAGTGTPEASERERQAWARLADFCGPERAAWVARETEPDNPGARPAAATDPEAPLPAEPAFAAPPERESSWTRRPYASALPDRWVALGYTAAGRAFLATGKTIPDRLAAGPDPSADGPAQTGDALQLIDDEMRWLIDFDAAVQNGMGIRVTLPAAAANGFARLIVVGVKGSMDAAESADAVAELLDNHHYTRGTSFLMRGTPTNNTGTAPSGYGTRDPGHERSFAAERQAQLFAAGSGTAGDLAARALGIDPAVFFHSWNAGDDDDLQARNMNTALWPATWGYYLDKRLPGLVTDDHAGAVRAHFIRYVRGGGPLPALRLRNQPYGLLPVTALDLWEPADSGDVSGRALSLLRNLQDAYGRAVAAVPRMGSDPDQDLLAVLRMSPISTRYSVRHMLGPWHVDNFFSFAGTNLNLAWWTAQANAARSNVSVPGMPPNTPQATSLFADNTRGIVKPPVTRTPSQDYLAALADADLTTLRNNTTLPAGERTLLYDLARHGLLLAFAGAAYRIQSGAGLVTAADRLEPELVDIDPAKPTLTIWRQLERQVPNVTGSQTLREFLSDPAREAHPDAAELAGTRSSLRRLAGVRDEKLELLLRETLDTASHRFDAWATSLATRRLDTLRNRRAGGVLIGGYGWVENLAPSAAPASDGYIQTPSVAHATAAAILASGYMAHRGDSGPNPFAVDLSSARVRLAYRLMEGVRTGQPIGALLGYELERSLHEQNLSVYVARFRRIAPLASTPTTGQEVAEAVAANNVVHGIRILELWKNKDPRFEALRTPANIADFQKIDLLFTKLADQVDALGDVILADNVYQVAEGNFDRAALTLSAVIAGQSLPEPEVLRTPRTGVALSHRVLSLLDPNQQAGGWPVDALQTRAKAEPCANAWAARMLGDSARIRCRAQYSTGGAARLVRLSELKLSPLDAIFAAAAAGASRTSELEQRLTYLLVRTRPAGTPPDVTITLDYSRDPNWTPDILSFDDFLALATALRTLLAKARPLTAADLGLADDNLPHSLDAAELRTRAEDAVTALRAARTRLQAAVAAAGAPLEPVRAALVRLAYLGLNNAIPISASDGAPDDGRLAGQGRAALGEVNKHLQKLDEMAAGFNRGAAGEEALMQFDSQRLRVIFGTEFPVLPRFTPPNAAELAVAFQNSDALQRNRRIEAETWFARAALVRENLGRLADVLRLADVFGRDTPGWTVGRMPFVPGETWVALPAVGTLPGGRLSLVAHGPVAVQANQPAAGLVWDEWSEVVPSRTEATALAFHYDRPGSRPPQAVLLAVAPDLGKPWDLVTVEQILRETFALSQIRLVDQDAMLELDHFLPALCFPINKENDTIAVDLRAG